MVAQLNPLPVPWQQRPNHVRQQLGFFLALLLLNLDMGVDQVVAS
jgi:hypothetical protein